MVYGGPFWTWAVVIAGLLMLARLHDFELFAAHCVQCGGKGKHRQDCPFNKEG